MKASNMEEHMQMNEKMGGGLTTDKTQAY